jgi:hypothetical protein
LNKNTLIFLLLFILFPVFAHAESLRFVWSYPVNEIPNIAGFRLYRDGQIIDTDNIPPTATTVTVERQTDKKNHVYFLTAFSATDESKASDTAIDIYSYSIKAVGNLTIEVINN